ncbi:hypothetical protein Pmani_024530 [Petrolisthes manimaculis]|uniref:Uncharacterized protein n=1 Tax=Petrolisthes manimaculis TaxID=1843537 RepID=A0AAE1P7L2_9EUCA|nr:hypothetical protein Pmani_024530 [Petrolisthes manimaculis]
MYDGSHLATSRPLEAECPPLSPCKTPPRGRESAEDDRRSVEDAVARRTLLSSHILAPGGISEMLPSSSRGDC